MSWTGEFEEAIRKAECSLRKHPNAVNFAAAASANYSGAGTCFALVKKYWLHVPRAIACLVYGYGYLRRAKHYADQAYLLHAQLAMRGRIGPDTLNADQIDVLCTVWYRLTLSRRRAIRARGLLRQVAGWRQRETSYGALRTSDGNLVVGPDTIWSLHTEAFIRMHRVRYGLDEWSESTHDHVLRLAEQTATSARAGNTEEQKRSGLGQAARIMRQLAHMLPRSDPRRQKHLQLAKRYAREGNVTDQLLKLGQ